MERKELYEVNGHDNHNNRYDGFLFVIPGRAFGFIFI